MGVWAHSTSLVKHHLSVHPARQVSEWSCIYVRGIAFNSFTDVSGSVIILVFHYIVNCLKLQESHFGIYGSRCMIKSIPFGKYRRYSITFGYYNDSFWKLLHISNYAPPKKMEKDQEHR